MKVCVRRILTRGLLAGVGLLIGLVNPASAYTEKVLYSFCQQPGCTDGQNPTTLMMDPSGNLYGTTESGVVFRLTPARRNWKFKALATLTGKDGEFPFGPLALDVAGNLYGTTISGGAHSQGTAYELMPVGRRWKVKVLHQFCSHGGTACTDGSSSYSGLTYSGAAGGALYDGVSPLFGTTFHGGAVNSGTVYTLTPGDQWTEKVIHSFCADLGCTDGELNSAPLMLDDDGNLFGTTLMGGPNHEGTIFELALNRQQTKWKEAVLFSTACSGGNCPDGQHADGTLLRDASGNFYGTANVGGAGADCTNAGGCGVIFKLDAASQYSVLYNFCNQPNCTDGWGPLNGLSSDETGNLYGTTQLGGNESNGGTVFELSGTSLQTLYSFCSKTSCSDGAQPIGNVILDGAGHIYGTTLMGGAAGGGTVFELVP